MDYTKVDTAVIPVEILEQLAARWPEHVWHGPLPDHLRPANARRCREDRVGWVASEYGLILAAKLQAKEDDIEHIDGTPRASEPIEAPDLAVVAMTPKPAGKELAGGLGKVEAKPEGSISYWDVFPDAEEDVSP